MGARPAGDRQHATFRPSRVAAAVATVTAMLTLAGGRVDAASSATPAAPRAVAAPAAGCPQHTNPDDSGTTIEVECPPDPGNGTPGNNDGPGPSGASDPCGWVNLTGDALALARESYPEAPPDAVFQQFRCTDGSGPLILGIIRWIPAAQAAQPTAQEVATQAWIGVRATLQRPDPVTSPADGVSAIVGVPTFVEVSNWQGTIIGDYCDGPCITLVATPTLRFDPGEAGGSGRADSQVIECDPPGTRFDPDGPDAADQAAAEGACAYAYDLRTGVNGRPDAWPGVVSVTWEASWTTTFGESGTFEPITLDRALPRAVEEVHGLVVSSGGGR